MLVRLLPPGGSLVLLRWPVLLVEAKVLPTSGIVFFHPNELVRPGHERLHCDHGESYHVGSQVKARLQGLLDGFGNHFIRSALDLAVDRPESLGELGDILTVPHPEAHKVGVRLWDDPVGLELLQEGVPELALARDGALRE